MKNIDYLRIKVYVFIVLFAFTFGWAFPTKVNIRNIEGNTFYDTTFSYSGFGLICTIGFGLTLLNDFKKRRDSDEY